MIIIGIAFVVDELKKGQRLVFRYPEAVPSFVLNNGHSYSSFYLPTFFNFCLVFIIFVNLYH